MTRQEALAKAQEAIEDATDVSSDPEAVGNFLAIAKAWQDLARDLLDPPVYTTATPFDVIGGGGFTTWHTAWTDTTTPYSLGHNGDTLTITDTVTYS